MKIITWNCNMAFRNKAKFILAHKPDLLIVPECEHPDRLLFPARVPKPTDTLWFGKNKTKGFAIFSYSEFRLRVLDVHNEDFKMIVPISVEGGCFDFILFAIWAYNPTDKDGKYVTQIVKAIKYYEKLFNGQSIVLMGDFNSNPIWDKKTLLQRNHTTVMKQLEEKGIFSTYHLYHGQTPGSEKHPTLYMYRHKDKPYHIDYCFVSTDLIDRLQSVEIGKHRYWSKYSDHAPLIVTFDTRIPEKVNVEIPM